MRGIAFWFFGSAVVYVTCGMLFGLWMSGSHDHTLASAHAHLNLVGWVTMGLFGVYYHLVPAAAASQLAKVHFALATVAVWLMFPGIILAVRGQIGQHRSLLPLPTKRTCWGGSKRTSRTLRLRTS